MHVNIPEYKGNETGTRGCDQDGTREGETLIQGTYIDRCHRGRVSTKSQCDRLRSETITLRRGIGQTEEHNVGLYL